VAGEQASGGRRFQLSTSYQAEYIESLREQWLRDPGSLDATWQAFFEGFELARREGEDRLSALKAREAEQAAAQSRVASLIFAYRNLGHLLAHTNPLTPPPESHPDLALERFGFSEADLDRSFDTGHLHAPQQATLREILAILRETYCGRVGVEYLHIQDTAQRRWLQARMEPLRNSPPFYRERKLHILRALIDAELFETFTHTRYMGQKRFSLEGAESVIAALRALVELAPDLGIEEVVMGVSHRGRLNILANVLQKSYAAIFSEFEDITLPGAFSGDGDVKYHKGYTSDYKTDTGRHVHLTLTANPSHLEAVAPVVLGRVRAKQRQRHDTEYRKKVLPLLLHGDAAFAGQGMVAEVFNLSHLPGYRVGGSVHVIINNQIGFTTPPSEARSTPYATDVAKMAEAPIFHVNGDDPEAVVFVTDLALRFRQEFGRDVIVDIICYRRHGHNEADEPAITQPVMYEKIRRLPSTRLLYTKRLIESGDLTAADGERLAAEFQRRLQEEFENVKKRPAEPLVQAFEDRWEGLREPYSDARVETGVARETLREITRALCSAPPDFATHPKVARLWPARLEAIEKGGPVDWAFAESLAFGSLLLEGSPVRLTGQDSQRGTFSQRHAVWVDMRNEEYYIPLNHIRPGGQARFCVYNSPLSEESVLGFEYGYSLSEPGMLILWEAQFGDFANGAQVILDQFLFSSESKWQRTSGLTLLLPHGYEGQGPEHSNAYLERYLAACAEKNIQVCNATTPAQYFHLLRRQVKRRFRRPLILMAPKSLLRHKRCVSPVADLEQGAFEEVLDDPEPPGNPARVALCSGKVFYDLLEFREQEGIRDTALVRVEQFYPFPERKLRAALARYPGARELVWAQEEPQNRGGWTFIGPRLRALAPAMTLRYSGRPASASPAVASLRLHKQEQAELVRLTFEGGLYCEVPPPPPAAATGAAGRKGEGAA